MSTTYLLTHSHRTIARVLCMILLVFGVLFSVGVRDVDAADLGTCVCSEANTPNVEKSACTTALGVCTWTPNPPADGEEPVEKNSEEKPAPASSNTGDTGTPATKPTPAKTASGGGSINSPDASVTKTKLTNPIGSTDIKVILGQILAKVLGILGGITLLVFVVGGAYWLLSAGNPERIKKGTETMIWAVIGLFVIFASYGLLTTFLAGLTGGYAPTGSGSGSGGGGGGVVYYVVGDADAPVVKSAGENQSSIGTLGAKVACVPSIGLTDGWVQIQDAADKATGNKISGFVKASFLTVMKDASACGSPTPEKTTVPQTTCETNPTYSQSHACMDTKKLSKTLQKGCISNQCQNKVLLSQGKISKKSEGNSWKCCPAQYCLLEGTKECVKGGGGPCVGQIFGTEEECTAAKSVK